jgi:cephalosporin hydroxylase
MAGLYARWRERIAAVVILALAALCAHLYLRDFYGSDAVVNRFHRMYTERLGGDNLETWGKNTWLGVPALQNPMDAWIIQEIITEVRPDYIVETGTLRGGGAVLWASILNYVNPEGKVLTVDIEDLVGETRQHPVFQQKVEFFLGSSTDPKIVDGLRARVQGKKTLVILDSDHRQAHVSREIELYGPMVSIGSYLVVSDTYMNRHPADEFFGPGPMEAVDQYLAAKSDFVRDLSRERMLFSWNPGGYLKRVK